MSRGVVFPWLLGAVIVLSCVAMGGRSGGSETPTAGSSDSATSATQLAFKARLDAALDEPALKRARVSVEALDCATGAVVYANGEKELLNPASNLKVLTSAVALKTLGPAFRFQTTLLYDGTFEGGVINGNLYVRGEGDPELVYEAVWKLVKDLQAKGLHTITGDLVADDSYFDDVRTITDWEEDNVDDETHAYNAPLGALSFNFNTVAMLVRPGSAVGKPVEVSFETPTGYVTLDNRATTARRGARSSLWFSRAMEGDKHTLRLDGQLPLSYGSRRFYRTVPDPPMFALTLLSELMAREGLVVKGSLRRGVTPEKAAPLHYHYSSSLDILLKYMNKLSSNFIAEQTLKAIGARVYGVPGTTEKGVAVLRDFVKKSGLEWDDAQILNGSGLSYRTKVSAHQLASLLCYIHEDFQLRYDYLATLPIAGVDGTMRNRLKGSAVTGNLRAKTGSIKGVFGFSGFAQDTGGRLLAFSFLVNDIAGSVQPIKQAQDRWASVLVAGPGQAPEVGPVEVGATLPPEGEGENIPEHAEGSQE